MILQGQDVMDIGSPLTVVVVGAMVMLLLVTRGGLAIFGLSSTYGLSTGQRPYLAVATSSSHTF